MGCAVLSDWPVVVVGPPPPPPRRAFVNFPLDKGIAVAKSPGLKPGRDWKFRRRCTQDRGLAWHSGAPGVGGPARSFACKIGRERETAAGEVVFNDPGDVRLPRRS